MSKADINVQNAFYMEPAEIVKYFEKKQCKISFDWQEVYEDAHAKAFTVAKMTQMDLLNDTQKMLTKAIKEGWSGGKFKKNATELFEKKGWVGKKEVINPNTGEKQTVELGTPQRIKKIFDCNMRSAYAVGRYKEQMENVDVAPYLQYNCILDGKTRPEHAAMHGKVFRYDDPIWNSMYPPNGWNCRCFVTQLLKSDVKRKNLTVENSDGNLREVEVLAGEEKKTVTAYDFKANGKILTLKPDAGWSTNLGVKAWNLDVLAYSKIKNLPVEVKDKFISEMALNPYNRLAIQNTILKTIQNDLKSRGNEIPLTWFTPKIIQTLENSNIRLQTPVVVFEDRQVKHSLSDRKVDRQRLTKKQFCNLYSMVQGADEIYLDTQDFAIIYVKYLPKNEVIDGRDCVKIPVKINSDNPKRPVNYVGTTGRIESENIKTDKRYKKIESWIDAQVQSS